MSNFCSDQGRTRVYGEAYFLYAVAENLRRTPSRAKKAIYGWALGKHLLFGDVAQLGERGVRNAEVRGSNPLISTSTLKKIKIKLKESMISAARERDCFVAPRG